MSLSYRRVERNGFVWTTDRMLNRGTVHRCYLPSDRDHPVARITREKWLYVLTVKDSLRQRKFGSLEKARDTAEMYVSKNFHQLGFELVARKRKR